MGQENFHAGAAASDERKGDANPQGPGDSGSRGSCWAGSTGSGSSWWGNTSCGKTTLIKAPTGASAMQPRTNCLKPSITVHAGSLLSRVTVIYTDRWRPVPAAPQPRPVLGHPAGRGPLRRDPACEGGEPPQGGAAEGQRAHCPAQPGPPAPMQDSVLEAHNMDLVPGYHPSGLCALAVSALQAGPGGAEGWAGSGHAECHGGEW